MQRIDQIAAVSHYPFPVTREMLNRSPENKKIAEFPSEYRISVSTDGEEFTECDRGIFRIFGGEEMIRFDACEARFIRLEVLSTVGRASGLIAHANAPLTIGEITVYQEH